MSSDCSDYISHTSVVADDVIALPKNVAWVHGVEGSLIVPIKSNPKSGGDRVRFGITRVTDHSGGDSIMSEIPIISTQFKTKLNINNEIKELLSVDTQFNYIFYNVIKIIDDIFDKYSNPGFVEVVLESDENNPKWKHADIKIKLDNDSLVSEIWRRISKSTKEFYKSAHAKNAMPIESLKRIHKFIYIIVDSVN